MIALGIYFRNLSSIIEENHMAYWNSFDPQHWFLMG